MNFITGSSPGLTTTLIFQPLNSVSAVKLIAVILRLSARNGLRALDGRLEFALHGGGAPSLQGVVAAAARMIGTIAMVHGDRITIAAGVAWLQYPDHQV